MRHHNDDLILHHFNAREFGANEQGRADWWQFMDPAVLIRLDVFRGLWGDSFTVSGHPRALGRHAGSSTSDHNFDLRGKVQCADGFPAGLRTQADALRAQDCARRAGFSSIGLYPHWNGGVGLHLGVRDGAGGRQPMATWGAVLRGGQQTFVSWDEALKALPEA